MPFYVHAQDQPDVADQLMELSEEHWSYVTPPPRERGGFSLCLVGVATDQPGP
ncbi:hypothetical protein [Streptomyces sp. NPDC102283]|uniref:hypothetical protein n=1 Tax=Streptomyces sp. NPDC102283 TaxID=3366155 RepID=UPI0038195821